MKRAASSSYTQAGVDIDAANAAKRRFASLLNRKGVTLSRPNAYAAIIDAGLGSYRDPVLVLKSEEPGSKQLIAFDEDKVESVCFDMINHLVNDCIVCGAKPISIQDVVICGKIDPEIIQRIVSSIAEAAQAQNCFLSGGETSEQPGVLPAGRYVLSSSIVGIIERNDIVDGSAIRSGDIVIGLASSGLHTNGYSLVRRLMTDDPSLRDREIGSRRFIDVLLDVHTPYQNILRPLFDLRLIKGAAHITGGGIKENLDRILPTDVDAVVDLRTYRPQPIFRAIRDVGNLDDAEMLRTFNMGIGMAIVVDANESLSVLTQLEQSDCTTTVIGRIVNGSGNVQCEGEFSWG